MKPSERNIITAFLTALAQLDTPLPENEKNQLQAISKDLANQIYQLHELAISYPQLEQLYQRARQALVNPATIRNKGPRPIVNATAENRTTEIPNTSVAIETRSDQELLATITTVFNDPEPVKAAQSLDEVNELLPFIRIA